MSLNNPFFFQEGFPNSWSQHICWPGVKIHIKHESESFPRQFSSISLSLLVRLVRYSLTFWIAVLVSEGGFDSTGVGNTEIPLQKSVVGDCRSS